LKTGFAFQYVIVVALHTVKAFAVGIYKSYQMRSQIALWINSLRSGLQLQTNIIPFDDFFRLGLGQALSKGHPRLVALENLQNLITRQVKQFMELKGCIFRIADYSRAYDLRLEFHHVEPE
jgi:hypothetical protein